MSIIASSEAETIASNEYNPDGVAADKSIAGIGLSAFSSSSSISTSQFPVLSEKPWEGKFSVAALTLSKICPAIFSRAFVSTCPLNCD